jgi:RimJ/RimL family protein N-acetyltransferase
VSATTARLELRAPLEADRGRFVELFGDPAFMVFSDGALDAPAANARFDRMLASNAEIAFAKQPVIERATGRIVGYVGVDRIRLDERAWLEFGYRLVPEARGRGYATEAGRAALALAAQSFRGELLAIIHRENDASRRVARKLGFAFWKGALVAGEPRELSLLRVG